MDVPAVDPHGFDAVADDCPRASSDSEALQTTSKYTRLSAADIRTVLELHDRGLTQTAIAKAIGKSQSSISNTLKQFDADSKAVARQLRAFTDETITDWRRARRVAAKRGDHRPARELLEAAHPELRPQQASHNHGGVTVVVAVPGGLENPRPVITVTQAKGDFRPSLSPVIEGESLTVSD